MRGISFSVSSIVSFTQRASVAHYNVLGQYTFPLDDDPNEAPSIGNLDNAAGQIALTIIPIIPVIYLLSITMIPLIGNSWESIQTGFHTVLHATFLLMNPCDLWVPQPEDERSVLQHIYGLPGLVLGSALGLISAVPFLLLEWWQQTFTAAFYITYTVHNCFRTYGDPIITYADPNKGLSRCWLLGLPLGLVFASLYAALCFVSCLISLNVEVGSYFSAYVANITLLDCQDHEKIPAGDYPEILARYHPLSIFALPGAVIGVGLGLISIPVILLGRIVIHSCHTAIDLMNAMIELSQEGKNKNLSTPRGAEPRQSYLKYGFGFLGLPVGFVLGMLASAVILLAQTLFKILGACCCSDEASDASSTRLTESDKSAVSSRHGSQTFASLFWGNNRGKRNGWSASCCLN